MTRPDIAMRRAALLKCLKPLAGIGHPFITGQSVLDVLSDSHLLPPRAQDVQIRLLGLQEPRSEVLSRLKWLGYTLSGPFGPHALSWEARQGDQCVTLEWEVPWDEKRSDPEVFLLRTDVCELRVALLPKGKIVDLRHLSHAQGLRRLAELTGKEETLHSALPNWEREMQVEGRSIPVGIAALLERLRSVPEAVRSALPGLLISLNASNSRVEVRWEAAYAFDLESGKALEDLGRNPVLLRYTEQGQFGLCVLRGGRSAPLVAHSTDLELMYALEAQQHSALRRDAITWPLRGGWQAADQGTPSLRLAELQHQDPPN